MTAVRPTKLTREEVSAAKVMEIPGIKDLGPLHKTCPSIQLTESETEYTVQCVKHIFENHVVFQVCALINSFESIFLNLPKITV